MFAGCRPEARAYAFNAVNEGYIKPYGLHHWWLDCDEPCGANPNLLYNNGTWPSSFVGAAYGNFAPLLDRAARVSPPDATPRPRRAACAVMRSMRC